MTIPLAIVWEGTVYGVIFLLSKAEIKPSLSHSCHTTENVSLFDWPPGLEIFPKSKSELPIWASSGLSSLESWQGLAVQVDRPLCWMGPQYWSSLIGLEAKIGPPVRGLARIRAAVKDAHGASSSQQSGLDLTVFLEDVSDSSPPTLVWGPNIWQCYSGCSCHLSRCKELSWKSTHSTFSFIWLHSICF